MAGLRSSPGRVGRSIPCEHNRQGFCPAANSAALTLQGAWTWYWGFEVTSSSTNRTAARCCGVDVFGPHIKCINLVVHDAGVGIGCWTPATDAEIYGCLIYNNGWQGPGRDRGHGHAIYAQNAQGTKRIRNIIIFNWSRAATVPLDLGAVLPKGTAFELRNSQDFFGPPVLKGRYDGQPIHVPMTGLTSAKPTGFQSPAPSSCPGFNVFVLLPVANASR